MTDASKTKPITKSEVVLISLYIVIALVRQVRHDIRNIVRWAGA